jgi:hypothetical protein
VDGVLALDRDKVVFEVELGLHRTWVAHQTHFLTPRAWPGALVFA